MNILHIDSSPQQENSISRQLSSHLLDMLDSAQIIYRDLSAGFPPLAPEDLMAIHSSADSGSPDLDNHLAISNELIKELFQADTLIIGVAVHNFSVPAVLKRWIDYVARAGVTFRYTKSGFEGLSGIDTAYLIVATGGTPVGSDMDFASGYLKHICEFLGVANVHIIDAAGSKREPDKIIANARAQINQLTRGQSAA